MTTRWTWLRLAALLLAVGSARASAVVAVLSGDTGPYKEALDGLKAVLGEVDSAILPGLPPMAGAQVVVTFGGEAALKKYPATVALVAALLPDPKLKPAHSGKLTRVGIPPAPAALIEKIKGVETGTLGVLDPGGYGDYAAALKAAGEAGGLAVQVKKVVDVADLAAKLPGLKGVVKSLWIPPDPLFMNPKTFALVAGVCKASGISLIAPVPALAKAGAAAGVAPSFKQQGQAAGEAAQAYAAGGNPGAWVYSSKVEFVSNK